MSKSSIYSSVLVATSFIVPALAFAATQDASNITGTLTATINIARLLVTLLFVLALVVFVWGMIKLILAAGNPDGIKEAKSYIWWSVIAMAVLASVFGLVAYLQTLFGVTSGGGFPVVPIPPISP